MTGENSGGALKQIQRLFNIGAAGTMTDAQLLERFISRREEAAEAAFEELVVRHGPMVLGVCRRVLHDVHDAEDSFQATFLVLAERAGSIVRRGSVGSWLFGVAYRISARARARAARQRASERMIAARTPESCVPGRVDLDLDILHAEIARLPERLRSPIVLCYLQGLTYLEASRQLNVTEGILRGRLERARKRLCHRLTRRGVTIPAGFVGAVGAGSMEAQAAVPAALVQSTVRIALGFVTCETATLLARGVLSSMLLSRLKVVAAFAFVGVAGSLGFWQGLAAVSQDRAQTPARTAPNKKSMSTTESSAKPKASAPGPPYRLSGVVRVEGTGEPVARVNLRIRLGDPAADALEEPQIVVTGRDGRFTAEMPAGNAILFLSEPPPGFWIPSNQKMTEWIVFGPNQPLVDREYHVRKGAIWNFRFTRGVEGLPHLGYVVGSNRSGGFMAAADDDGQARLTLPMEGGKVTLRVQEDSPLASPTTGFLTVDLEWGATFRPDDLEDIVRLDGNGRGFRLTDADANSATILGPDAIQPVKENGGLVIRVVLADRRAQDVSSITGQIVDAAGKPVPGARVVIAMGGGGPAPSNQLWHRATTDVLGRYRLREIPRTTIDGKPLKVALIVSKEGYVGIQSQLLSLSGDSSQKPQVIEPIRLENGVPLRGVVVDHRGQPAAGASVRASFFVRLGQRGAFQAVKTDENGRFTFGNLPRHVIALTAFHGEIFKSIMFLADGSPDEARIQLPAGPREFPADIGAVRAAPPGPPAVGQAAPELEVGPWSDQVEHRLAKERGKVVVLYFWGISFDPSVCILPALGRLAKEFAPRGAVFLTIHNAEREPDEIRQQARKVLAFKGAPLPFAVDQMRVKFHARGVTADRYGQKMAPPFVVIVDRTGKIAFHSELATGEANVNATVGAIGGRPVSESEEQINERIERALRREIERAIK